MTTTPPRLGTQLGLCVLAAALLGFGCQTGSDETPAPAGEKLAAPVASAPTAAAPAAAAPPAPEPAAPGAQRPRARLFVTNYQDDTLSVLDLAQQREEKVIPMPESPEGLALRASPPLLAVVNSTGSSVTLMDPVSLEVLGTIPCGKLPDDLVFSRDGTKLFVTSAAESNVYVLDVAKRSTLAALPRFDSRPVRLELSPDGKRLYVLAKSNKGEVLAVDTTTYEILGRAPAGNNPTDLGISADGKWIVSASFDDMAVSVIDTATMTVVRTFASGTGFGLIVHPTKPIAYSMASFDDEVHVLDYEKGETLAVLSFGNYPTFSAMTPDGRYLYVVQEESDNVAVVDTETNQQVVRIAVGDEPSEAIYFALP